MLVLWYFIFGLIFGVLSSMAVKDKGRDQTGWFFIGFLFGLFGLIGALIISDNKNEQLDETIIENETIFLECPNCNAKIERQTKYCGKCGISLKEFCFNCKTKNRIDAKYCGNCGKELYKLK